MSHDTAVLEQLPPEKLLDTSNFRIITPAIKMMGKVETVDQYLEHERANRNRSGIIRQLTERRDGIYEERGEKPPQRHSEESASSASGAGTPIENSVGAPVDPDIRRQQSAKSPSEDLLALVHEYGPADTAESSAPPTWSEL